MLEARTAEYRWSRIDGSVEALGCKLDLEMERPFNGGRTRNAGWMLASFRSLDDIRPCGYLVAPYFFQYGDVIFVTAEVDWGTSRHYVGRKNYIHGCPVPYTRLEKD